MLVSCFRLCQTKTKARSYSVLRISTNFVTFSIYSFSFFFAFLFVSFASTNHAESSRRTHLIGPGGNLFSLVRLFFLFSLLSPFFSSSNSSSSVFVRSSVTQIAANQNALYFILPTLTQMQRVKQSTDQIRVVLITFLFSYILEKKNNNNNHSLSKLLFISAINLDNVEAKKKKKEEQATSTSKKTRYSINK